MSRIRRLFVEHRDSFLLGLVFLVSIIGMSTNRTAAPDSVRSGLMSVSTFFQNIGTTVGDFFANTISSIQELARLRDELDSMRRELDTYRQRAVNTTELEYENAELRRLLELKQDEPGLLIPAQIIAKTPGSLSKEFTVDAGAASGVSVNSPVVVFGEGERILVGKVTRVGNDLSLVEPVFSPSFYVAAKLQEQRYEGLVSGLGDDDQSFIMDYVDKSARNSLAVGSKVITSGLQSHFPRGLFIGSVSSVESQSWDTTIRLYIEPAVRFSRLEYVFILQPQVIE